MKLQYPAQAPVSDPAGGRTGVLLVNLGTPEAPTAPALRRYLGEFLADPRVVEAPRWLWWLVLHGVILRIRPRRSAAAYARVWGPQGSPLMALSRELTDAVREALRTGGAGVEVALAMRYGSPSIPEVLGKLDAAGVTRLLVVPLYPQYSATTTASVFDAVGAHFQGVRRMPELRYVNQYFDEPGYLDALAGAIREDWAANGRPARQLFSFHGIPQRYVDAGDPYRDHCEATTRALVERLGLAEGEWQLVFQSRFGREPWLQPYADHTLEALGRDGPGDLAVVCPGFAVDCLETIEEMGMENRDVFLEAGGESYRYIPALNASPAHAAALAAVVRRHAGDWLA